MTGMNCGLWICGGNVVREVKTTSLPLLKLVKVGIVPMWKCVRDVVI